MIRELLAAIRSALGFSAPERAAHQADLVSVSTTVSGPASVRLAYVLETLRGSDKEWLPLAALTWADETAIFTGSGCFTVPVFIAKLKGLSEEIRDSYDAGAKYSDDDQARLNAIRTAIGRAHEAAARRNWIHPLLRLPVKGSVPAARVIKAYDFVLAAGVHLLIGKGASGKSYLAHQLGGMDEAGAQTAAYGLLRVGEPLSGYDHEPATNAVNLLSAMFAFDVVVIDSVKDLLSMGGAAMKSGISRSAVATFSPWSSMACDLAVGVIAIVNISTPDAEAVDAITEAARSNATGVIVHTNGPNWKYFVRRGESLFRLSGTINIQSPEQGGAVSIAPDQLPKQPTGTTNEVSRAMKVSYRDLSDAIRRALSVKVD